MLVGIMFFAITMVSPASKLLGRVYFSESSSVVDSTQLEILKKVAQILKRDSTIMVDCIGYTDQSGSLRTNKIMAKKRAEAVKWVLTRNFGISPERIFVIAYGPDLNASSPDSARRTDIVIHKPDAILTDYQNRVLIQPFYYPMLWLRPHGGDPLYGYYRVKTGKLSLARVSFPEKGTLVLGSDALLIIYGKLYRKKKHMDNDIDLLTGKLMTLLLGKTQHRELAVKTPGAKIKLNASRSKIGVDRKKTTLVSIFEGYAEVMARGKKVSLKSGEGTYVIYGKKPSPPHRLPEPPEIMQPDSGDTVYVMNSLQIKWHGSTQRYRLQIFKKDTSFKIIVDTTVADSEYRLHPPAYNTYYMVKMASIDSTGLESETSLPCVFYVGTQRDTTPPQIFGVEIKKQGYARYLVKIKSEPGVTVYVGNHVVETGNDSTVEVVLKTTEKVIPLKIKDEYGNTTHDTLLIKYRRSHILSLGAGILKVHGDERGSSLFMMKLDYRLYVYKSLFLGGKIEYVPNSKSKSGILSLSYIPATGSVFPEFLFSYGLVIDNGHYYIGGPGVALHVRVFHRFYLSPALNFYSSWNSSNKGLSTVSLSFSYLIR